MSYTLLSFSFLSLVLSRPCRTLYIIASSPVTVPCLSLFSFPFYQHNRSLSHPLHSAPFLYLPFTVSSFFPLSLPLRNALMSYIIGWCCFLSYYCTSLFRLFPSRSAYTTLPPFLSHPILSILSPTLFLRTFFLVSHLDTIISNTPLPHPNAPHSFLHSFHMCFLALSPSYTTRFPVIVKRALSVTSKSSISDMFCLSFLLNCSMSSSQCHDHWTRSEPLFTPPSCLQSVPLVHSPVSQPVNAARSLQTRKGHAYTQEPRLRKFFAAG